MTADELQTAIDTAFNAGGGTVDIPAGNHSFNHPILLRSKVTVAGAGRRATTLTATASMPVFLAPSEFSYPASSYDNASANFHPVHDTDGLILNGDVLSYLELTDAHESQWFPSDGTFEFQVDLKWTSGTGYVWGLGGKLLSTDTQRVVDVDVTSGGTVRATVNGTYSRSSSVALASGTFTTVKVSVLSDGDVNITLAGTLRNGTTSGAKSPIAIRWWHRLVVGALPQSYPTAVTGDARAGGRVRSAVLTHTNGSTTFTLNDASNSGVLVKSAGRWFVVRYAADSAGRAYWNLRDLAIDAAADGYGVFVTNSQNWTVSNVEVTQSGLGFYSEKNCYEASARDLWVTAFRRAVTLAANGGMFLISNLSAAGGDCQFAAENSYGVDLDHAWLRNTNPTGVNAIVAGDGCQGVLSKVKLWDESSGPPVTLLLARDIDRLGLVACSLQRFTAYAGEVITADGANVVLDATTSLRGYGSTPLVRTLNGGVVTKAWVDRPGGQPFGG